MDKLPTPVPAPGKMPPEHQRRVDEIQAALRSEAVPARPSLFKPAPPRPAPSTSLLDHRIAEEMEYIVRQLEQLGGILANDSILLVRHAAQLQAIDLIKQSIRNLASVVVAEDKALAADRITLTELKARLQRKALKPIGEGQPPPDGAAPTAD